MIRAFTEWAARKMIVFAIHERLRNLESSVTMAERLIKGPRLEESVRITRLLLSGEERLEVTGTEDQIVEAAARMARRTRSCVTVAVVVAYHHRRGCTDRRTGGFDTVGN